MPLVKAQCTECGATIEVNPEATNLTCRYCGSNFIVEKAIKNYNVHLNNSNVTNNFAGANVTIVNNGPVQPQVQYRELTIFWNKRGFDFLQTVAFYCDNVELYRSKKAFKIKLQITNGPHIFRATFQDLGTQNTNTLHVDAGTKPLVIEIFNHVIAAPEIAFR